MLTLDAMAQAPSKRGLMRKKDKTALEVDVGQGAAAAAGGGGAGGRAGKKAAFAKVRSLARLIAAEQPH